MCIALKCISVCADSRGKDAKNPTNQTSQCNMRFLLYIWRNTYTIWMYTQTHAHKKKDYTKRKRKINLLKDEKKRPKKSGHRHGARTVGSRCALCLRKQESKKKTSCQKQIHTTAPIYIYLCIVRISARTIAWTVDVMCKKKKAGMCPCTTVHMPGMVNRNLWYGCVCLWIFVKCDGHRFFVARALIWVFNLFWIFEHGLCT